MGATPHLYTECGKGEACTKLPRHGMREGWGLYVRVYRYRVPGTRYRVPGTGRQHSDVIVGGKVVTPNNIMSWNKMASVSAPLLTSLASEKTPKKSESRKLKIGK